MPYQPLAHKGFFCLQGLHASASGIPGCSLHHRHRNPIKGSLALLEDALRHLSLLTLSPAQQDAEGVDAQIGR